MWNRTFVKLSIIYYIEYKIDNFYSQTHWHTLWHYAALALQMELFIVFEKYRYLLLLTINVMLYDTSYLQGKASHERLSGTKVSNIKGLATFKI